MEASRSASAGLVLTGVRWLVVIGGSFPLFAHPAGDFLKREPYGVYVFPLLGGGFVSLRLAAPGDFRLFLARPCGTKVRILHELFSREGRGPGRQFACRHRWCRHLGRNERGVYQFGLHFHSSSYSALAIAPATSVTATPKKNPRHSKAEMEAQTAAAHANTSPKARKMLSSVIASLQASIPLL